MIEKTIEQLASKNGKNSMQIMSDFLDYFIHGFNPSDGPMTDWKYGEQSNKLFYDCCIEIVQEYEAGIKKHGWCDPLGDLFMSIMGKKDTSRNGVFFTPEGICELMTSITLEGAADAKELPKQNCGAFGNRIVVNDCSVGSGRNLLSAASKFIGKPRAELPYFVGEDIDGMCCKMTAVNLMCHGLPGEVICHNTLTEPNTCKFGFIVNEGLFPISGGLPTIRRFTDPDRFVTLRARRRSTTHGLKTRGLFSSPS